MEGDMMNFTVVKTECPSCSATPEMDKNMEFGFCPYCRTHQQYGTGSDSTRNFGHEQSGLEKVKAAEDAEGSPQENLYLSGLWRELGEESMIKQTGLSFG